jgi:hypothetical protein
VIKEDLSKDYFLPYQVAWIADDSHFKLWDKSRRIGATYAESYRAVRRRNLSDVITGSAHRMNPLPWNFLYIVSSGAEFLKQLSKL